MMGVGPSDAVRDVLCRAGLEVGDVDAMELNDGFAGQLIPVCRELEIDFDRQLDLHGGAIALGHPLEIAGARLIPTALSHLRRCDGEIALDSLYVSGRPDA